MHGSVRREGEGRSTSPGRCISWHMHSAVIAADSKSFYKDGRRISVGDCALFKPPQDSPPFIGLIRWLTLSKENSLQLGVNWLYRPAELKLGKGTLLDSAPNEIFYSFHKDEAPAASLLHPCKVAFLPRGVELPTGTSSFVCRRVYDIANNCLWWLTDQDYINERQEEVDNLLYKTRTEMHATLQPDGRSPKQVNGPTSTAQLKSGSDNVQSSGNSFPTQVKGKKRERGDRGDHGAEPVKRERSSKIDDGDSANHKTESNLKTEIGRITEKGGLVDLEGVEKLVQLMQQDRMERKMDLSSRSMLAGVIAATDKVDCLNRFVYLRGLPVMDEWLQDIHKGKIADGNSSKDSDKPVEEFLLVLLRALDKLPVNLHALQMCNIGRSVNHLRSHKNLEIQRKARSLVDTWKKRVEAEMISIDAKSGSTQPGSVWPSKSRLPEASHGGNRTPSGSDVAIKSSITHHSASKTTAKSSHGESNTKSASSSPGPVKPTSSPAPLKETQTRTSVGGSPDVPLIREDRSSSSNQSHNYSPSFSVKEEGKSFSAVSATVSKVSGSSSRNRKNSGFPGVSVSGGQKETSSIRSSSVPRSTASEKLSQSALTSDRALEAPVNEGSSHKLIVKIPNRVFSPAQGVSGGSLEDPSNMSSRASSPVVSDKNELFDNEKGDTYQSNGTSDMNAESWQMNDTKDVLTGSGEGSGSPDGEVSMTTEDSRKLTQVPRKDQLKSGKLHDTSFSPMNALVESCAKYSEAHSSLSLEDDVGMNLLASVATGEISRSDLVSPTDSTERSTPAAEEACNGDDAKSRSSSEIKIAGGQNQFCNDNECNNKKQALSDGSLRPTEGLDLSKHSSHEISGDMKRVQCDIPSDGPTGEGNKLFDSLTTDMRSTGDAKLDIGDISSNEKTHTDSVSTNKMIDGVENKQIHEDKAPSSNVNPDDIANSKSSETNIVVAEVKDGKDLLNADEGKKMVESPNQSCEGDCKSDVNGLNKGTVSQQKLTDAFVKSEFAERTNEKLQQTTSAWKLMSEAGNEVKVGESDEKDDKSSVSKVERENAIEEVVRNTAPEVHSVAGSCSTANDLKSRPVEAKVENKEISEHLSSPEGGRRASVANEAQKNNELVGLNSAGNEPDEAVSASSVAEAASSSAGASDAEAKIKFDLNEGFTVDDGKYVEAANLPSSSSTSICMINSMPFGVNSIPSGHPASITVAAAAKGPFVPPEDLLRNKVELGWKGSAATSAFRPAERRKVLEMPLASTTTACNDASTSKHGRAPLDFDLNVPDERVLEEMTSQDSTMAIYPTTNFGGNRATLLNESSSSMPGLGSGGLDLDLNRVDEANDNGHCSTSSHPKEEGSIAHTRPLGGLPACDVRRDFDLNNGPGIEDTNIEQLTINQQVKGGMPSQMPSVGLRMNNPGLGSFSSWSPPGNTFSTIAIPSVLPDRGDQSFPIIPPGPPQRAFGPAGITPFTPDIYRGSVLSSSPAVSFSSSHFQFPMFPFGATFPLPSATFPVGAASYTDPSSGARLYAPPLNMQFLGPVAISNQFQRPNLVSLPDSSSNGGLDNNRKWSRPGGLDLNAGPGAMETEPREDTLPLSSSQLSITSSQALADEQARIYSVSGGMLKRKEPEGGWDNESFRYKQPSWQ